MSNKPVRLRYTMTVEYDADPRDYVDVGSPTEWAECDEENFSQIPPFYFNETKDSITHRVEVVDG